MHCINCNARAYNKLCWRCKPRLPIKRIKRPRKIGKVAKQWISTRNEWIQKNLPDNGLWYCHYCNKPLTKNILTLDHKKSRSRNPELRFDLNNLVPACAECNKAKGSLSDEEYLERLGL